MTREDFKEYICNQIDLMSEAELVEFSNFLQDSNKEEDITQELVVIKGEFKKLTKLVQSMKDDLNSSKKGIDTKGFKPFIEFDALLKNSKDAIDSIPLATLFSVKKTNNAIISIQSGFNALLDRFRDVLDEVGLVKSAKEGEKFNPNWHEAIDVVEDKSLEDGVIIEVLEEGYLYKDKVIKYAKVKVNRWI